MKSLFAFLDQYISQNFVDLKQQIHEKLDEFLFIKIILLTRLGDKLERILVKSWPVLENILSDATEVAGIPKYY